MLASDGINVFVVPKKAWWARRDAAALFIGLIRNKDAESSEELTVLPTLPKTHGDLARPQGQAQAQSPRRSAAGGLSRCSPRGHLVPVLPSDSDLRLLPCTSSGRLRVREWGFERVGTEVLVLGQPDRLPREALWFLRRPGPPGVQPQMRPRGGSLPTKVDYFPLFCGLVFWFWLHLGSMAPVLDLRVNIGFIFFFYIKRGFPLYMLKFAFCWDFCVKYIFLIFKISRTLLVSWA